MRKTYRQWVEEGARGFFLTAGIVTEGTVIVATEIAFPDSEMATLLQGYVIRRQSYDRGRSDLRVRSGWMIRRRP
jgi:hypothetical protein